MVTKKRYQIKLHNSVVGVDLPNLPPKLKQDLAQYQKVLSLDPYKTKGIPNHSLIGDLRGYRTLEIDWNNISYRLVYRIYEKPAPKRVFILSFAEHDLAYEKAEERK